MRKPVELGSSGTSARVVVFARMVGCTRKKVLFTSFSSEKEDSCYFSE
jgi:hypothetical protein